MKNDKPTYDELLNKNKDQEIELQKLKCLVEHSPVAMHFYSLSNEGELIFTGANPAAEKVLGIKHQDLVGKTIEEAFPNLGITEYPELYKKTARKEIENHSFEIFYEDEKFSGYFDVHVFRLIENAIAVKFFDITDRKQTEEELLKNQKRYQKAQELGCVGNWEYDIVTTKFWASEETEKIFGFKLHPKELSTERVESCILQRERVHQALIDLLELDKKYDLVYDIVTEDKGIQKIIHSIAELEKDALGNPLKITGVVSDITIQKKADEALLKAKEKVEENQFYLKKAQEIGNIGTWELDLRKNKLIWTEENYHIFGIPPGTELTYEIFLNCIHPDDREYVIRAWQAALNNKPYDIEHRIIVDGKIKWVREKAVLEFDKNNVAIKGIGFAQDISSKKFTETELIKAKEKAQKNEIKFSKLFHISPEPQTVTSLENGKFIMVNDAFLKNTGFKREEIIDRTSVEINAWINDGDRQQWLDELKETGMVRSKEIPFRTKNYGIRKYLVSTDIIDLEEQKCTINIYLDITERKQMELELIKAKEKSEEKEFLIQMQYNDLQASEEEIRAANEELLTTTDALKASNHELNIAKEKAEESEQSYIGLFNSVSEAIYIQNKDGVFIDVNYGTYKMYGYTREELIGKTPEMLSAPNKNDMSHIFGLVKKVFETGNPERYEFWGIRKNGEIFPKEVITSRVKYFGKEAIITTARDITNRKQAELEIIKAKEKAQENELQLNAILEKSPTGFAINKIKSTEVTYVNQAFADAYHIPIELCSNVSTFFEYVYGNQMQLGNKILNDLKSGIPERMKWDKVPIIDKATDTTHYVSASNIVIEELDLMISTVRDITSQVENENKLIQSDRVFNLTLDMFCIAGFDGYFKYLNPAWKRTLGWSIDELLSKPWLDFVHPDDAEKTKNIKSVIVDGKEIYKFENRYICKDGSIKWLSWNSQPFQKENIMIGAVRDITQQKNMEQDLISAKEKAEESDRLKTAFLQNISHEIRTPLNAISGFSGRLNRPELSEEKRKSFISIIQNSSKQLISVVTDILTISSLETKQEKLNIDKVCVNDIIVELLTIFKQQSINQNIELYAKQELNNKQSEIYTDRTKITQILSNLLANALKFTHEGFVEFGYVITNTKGHPYLQFYVKDTGIGIEKEQHDKIFERFSQANISINRNYGGTGLGLSISKGFVELLGGKIWVHSEPDKGTSFYFTVPYKPANEFDKTTTPTKQNKNFKTVLVAEDEEFNFLFIEELLIDMDVNLIHAKDGKEALEICRAKTIIDLILMDIKMPVMNGHEAAKLIKEFKPDLPIIAQSAYALEHEIEKYSGIFDDYITKPINEEILIEKVSKYWIKKVNHG